MLFRSHGAQVPQSPVHHRGPGGDLQAEELDAAVREVGDLGGSRRLDDAQDLVRDDLGISLAAFGLITTAIFGGAAVATPGKTVTLQSSQILAAVRAYRQANGARILRSFSELLTIPNVASDVENIRRNAEHIRRQLHERGVEHQVCREHAADRSDDLCRHVGRCVRPAEAPVEGLGEGDGRIEVRARESPEREDEGQEARPEAPETVEVARPPSRRRRR